MCNYGNHWFLIKICILLLSFHANGSQPLVIGDAYAQGTDQLLYSEVHRKQVGDYQHVVSYVGPDGEPFGEKKLSYKEEGFAPTYSFFDNRINLTQGVKCLENSRFEVFHTRKDKPARLISHKSKGEPVVDAGFNNFILQNWDALSAGETIELDFLVPAKFRFVRFKIDKVDAGKKSDDIAWFRMHASNPIIHLMLRDIKLGYDKESKRLTTYDGISNIYNEKGKSQRVTIQYRYADKFASSEADF